MELYILRHGEAQARETGSNDETRALTDKGKRQVKAILRQTRRELNVDLVLTSPLLRALQTAELAQGPQRITDALKPEAAVSSLWKELCKDPSERVLLVGHQPHLGQFIAFLLGTPLHVDLKKGSLMRIDCEKQVSPRGVLKWFLIPRLL